MDGPERFYSWSEARPFFGGISKQTAWRMWRAGKLPPPVAVSGNRKAWPASAIVAWQQARMGQSQHGEN